MAGLQAIRDALPESARDMKLNLEAVLQEGSLTQARFRHMMGESSYAQKPARLRMNRLAKPRTSRSDLELFSLAASAINGCETCVRSHEKAVREAGLSDDQVNDAVRIAATIHAAAVALETTGLSTAA